jgi:hypothetical protein
MGGQHGRNHTIIMSWTVEVSGAIETGEGFQSYIFYYVPIGCFSVFDNGMEGLLGGKRT